MTSQSPHISHFQPLVETFSPQLFQDEKPWPKADSAVNEYACITLLFFVNIESDTSTKSIDLVCVETS